MRHLTTDPACVYGCEVFGIPIIVSDHLPIYPDHREDARRLVRHGLRRWVEYGGEDVGPLPGEPTYHMIQAGEFVIVSRDIGDALREVGGI